MRVETPNLPPLEILFIPVNDFNGHDRVYQIRCGDRAELYVFALLSNFMHIDSACLSYSPVTKPHFEHWVVINVYDNILEVKMTSNKSSKTHIVV